MPVMSISALASGLDTENIIEQLMDIERVTGSETKAAKTVLVTAVLTYQAATLIAFMELVKLVIMIAESRGRSQKA